MIRRARPTPSSCASSMSLRYERGGPSQHIAEFRCYGPPRPVASKRRLLQAFRPKQADQAHSTVRSPSMTSPMTQAGILASAET